MLVASKFNEVASGRKESLLFPRVGGSIDALSAFLRDPEDVVSLFSLDELKLIHLSCAHWLVFDLSVVELL